MRAGCALATAGRRATLLARTHAQRSGPGPTSVPLPCLLRTECALDVVAVGSTAQVKLASLSVLSPGHIPIHENLGQELSARKGVVIPLDWVKYSRWDGFGHENGLNRASRGLGDGRSPQGWEFGREGRRQRRMLAG